MHGCKLAENACSIGGEARLFMEWPRQNPAERSIWPHSSPPDAPSGPLGKYESCYQQLAATSHNHCDLNSPRVH